MGYVSTPSGLGIPVDMTAQRVVGVSYTADKTRLVLVRLNAPGDIVYGPSVGNEFWSGGQGPSAVAMSAVVPQGWTYKVPAGVVAEWWEAT